MVTDGYHARCHGYSIFHRTAVQYISILTTGRSLHHIDTTLVRSIYSNMYYIQHYSQCNGGLLFIVTLLVLYFIPCTIVLFIVTIVLFIVTQHYIIGISRLYPDPSATRLLLVDEKSDAYVYNPVNDVTIAVPQFNPSATGILWDYWPLDKVL